MTLHEEPEKTADPLLGTDQRQRVVHQPDVVRLMSALQQAGRASTYRSGPTGATHDENIDPASIVSSRASSWGPSQPFLDPLQPVDQYAATPAGSYSSE